MIETAIEPGHPRRLEKKAKLVPGSSVGRAARLFLIAEGKFVSEQWQVRVSSPATGEIRLEIG